MIPLPGNEVNIPAHLEIWGLSGWLLNKFAEKVGWLDANQRKGKMLKADERLVRRMGPPL